MRSLILSITHVTNSRLVRHVMGFREFSLMSIMREQIRSHDGGTEVQVTDKATANQEVSTTKGSISKAMKSYLERAEAHHNFMKEAEEEFVFGRRHLANMMGKDPATFTQQDIDESIRYLFPSGLFVPTARPKMKPPHEIYPKEKAAQFDASGRPNHPFFYTAKPMFYYIIHEAVSKMNALNAVALSSINSVTMDTFAGTVWISKTELEGKILESLSDDLYNEWTACMNRLAGHPHHDREKEFIQSYRKPLAGQYIRKVLPLVLLEADGRQSVKVEICQKKTAIGTVIVKLPGSGKIEINGEGLDYFPLMRAREAFIYPLQLVNWLGTVDITADISGSGEMAQAAALRWGISTAISSLGGDMETLRLAGLLTKDRRRKERKHVAHDGARAAWTWKKR